MAFIVFSIIHIRQSVSILGCALTVISIILIFSTMDFRTEVKSSCTMEAGEGDIIKISMVVSPYIAEENYAQIGRKFYIFNWYDVPDMKAEVRVRIERPFTSAVLDPTEKLCYISQTRARNSGFGDNNGSFRTAVSIMGEKSKIMEYNDTTFQVLHDKNPKFMQWKTDIILGDFIKNTIGLPPSGLQVRIEQKPNSFTGAVLDPAEKLCYISQTRARNSGFGDNNGSLRTTVSIMGENSKIMEYNDITFQVLDDKNRKFRYWKTGIILGGDFIEKEIDLTTPDFKHVRLTVERLRLRKPVIEGELRAILLFNSQLSEIQPHEVRGPFARCSSHRLADEGYIEIMALDRGITQAFALLQSRLQRGKETKLRWFPENDNLVALYSQRYESYLGSLFCIYWPRGRDCPTKIEEYVIRASKEEVLFLLDEEIKKNAVGKFRLTLPTSFLKHVVFGESLKLEVSRIGRLRKGLLPL